MSRKEESDNAIAPGLIHSSGIKTYPVQIQAMLQDAALELPARRMGTESEVAAAAIFLLSPAASFISGITLPVDGAGSLYRLLGHVIPEHRPWTAFDVSYEGETEKHHGSDKEKMAWS